MKCDNIVSHSANKKNIIIELNIRNGWHIYQEIDKTEKSYY